MPLGAVTVVAMPSILAEQERALQQHLSGDMLYPEPRSVRA
jgi:hypothetical protein